MTKIVSGDPTTTTHAVVFEDKVFSESNSSADKPTMVASTVWTKELLGLVKKNVDTSKGLQIL